MENWLKDIEIEEFNKYKNITDLKFEHDEKFKEEFKSNIYKRIIEETHKQILKDIEIKKIIKFLEEQPCSGCLYEFNSRYDKLIKEYLDFEDWASAKAKYLKAKYIGEKE